MHKSLTDPSIETSTWIDLLRRRARLQPDTPAFTFLVDGDTQAVSLTYAELERQARAIGAWLQHAGATGERALLLYPPGLEYVTAFFGCLHAGAIAVPTYPPRLNRPDPRLQAVVADAQATVALTTTSILATLEHRFVHAPDMKDLRWMATDNIDVGLAGAWRDLGATGGTVAFLQYTSGSTAVPKGVMVTHGNSLHNSSLISEVAETSPESRGVFWAPPYHDMGLIGGLLQTVYCGGTTTLMSPLAFLQQPLRWLQAISRTRATHSGGPNFAYDLCVSKITPDQRATLDLRSWRVAFSGAEPIRRETLDRFAGAFESCGFRREAFCPAYGLAEATLLVSCGEGGKPPRSYALRGAALEHHRVVRTSPESADARVLVGCGLPVRGQQTVIVDPGSLTRCPPGRIGEIWVSGLSIAPGYWNRPEESAEVFRAHLADTGEGPFLRTGDLGFLQDGELVVTGRLKDLIIVDGRNHYPQDIEHTVERAVPALRPGCCAAFSVDGAGGERLVVAAEVDRRPSPDRTAIARAIRRAVAEEHDLQASVVTLLKTGSMPKTSSGKIQRHVCRARFLSNTLDVLED